MIAVIGKDLDREILGIDLTQILATFLQTLTLIIVHILDINSLKRKELSKYTF